MTLSDQAKEYAILHHSLTNHLYDGRPYEHHLQGVVNVAMRYIGLIPEPDRHTVIAACWAHDVIEDARQTYNDVKAALGESVAEIVFAVTNEKGKTRKERANEKYYIGIRNTKYATFVKLCDRISNIEYSIYTSSGMLSKYEKENRFFTSQLWHADDAIYGGMFEYLHELLFAKYRVKEDMTCPVTGKHCDDECCTVGSECNMLDDGSISDKP